MISIIGRKIILRKGDNGAFKIIIRDYKGKDLLLSRTDKITMRVKSAVERATPIRFEKVTEQYHLNGDKPGTVSNLIVFKGTDLVNIPAGEYQYDVILEHGDKRFTVIPSSVLRIQESLSLADLDDNVEVNISLLDLDTIIDYDSIISPTPLIGIFPDRNYDPIEDSSEQVIELGGQVSRFKLAYGTQEEMNENITSGIITPGTLILVEDTDEIYLYDLSRNLHRYKERTRFDSPEEAESWITTHDCKGEILSIHEGDYCSAYIVDYEDNLTRLLVANDPEFVPDKNYTHIQRTSSDIWEIEHNLGKYPSVSVVDSAGNLVVGEVNYLNTEKLTITFTGSFSGKCYCN